ncbi:MAG: MarR family winged helix-turn-helix transcriptional regulator [Lachnospiraceae bacterium]
MEQNDLGCLIKMIDEKLRAKADADLKAHNLTMAQSTVLLFLSNQENCQATQKEIELHLNISHPAVTGIVSRMEQNHHLTTWIDPGNKRNKMVRLTPEARALGETMEQMRLHWEHTMLQGLSEEEIAQLKRLLRVVAGNLT